MFEDWLKDAQSGQDGFERQYKRYIGAEEYTRIQHTLMDALRRREFEEFIDYCSQKEKHQ